MLSSACLLIGTLMRISDRKIDPIPGLFQDVIERLMAMQIVTTKPDSCIIDIFNEVSSDIILFYTF